MVSSEAMTNTRPTRIAEEIYSIIADKVREDSSNLHKPTHVETLGPLFPEMTPEEIVNYLTELYEVDEYADIRAVVSANGAAYLYSTDSISPEVAVEKCLREETQTSIAAKVREDSKVNVRLTPVSSLPELLPDLTPEQVTKYTDMMKEDEAYQDIQSVIGPTGISYFFSETHMSRNYARLLARVEAKDPCSLIAETVREESRIYPRPTKVELFYAPVFQIESGQMEQVIEMTLQKKGYEDIKRLVAPTGTVYLYSDHFMDPRQAERWIEWEEVERLKNP